MPNRLHRDLVALRAHLATVADWRLTPEQWRRAERALDALVGALEGPDQQRVDAVVEQFEVIASGTRMPKTSFDDTRRSEAPEPLRLRIVEQVPVIVDRIDRFLAEDRQPRTGTGDAHAC